MSQHDESLGPLANEWRRVNEMLCESELWDATEIESFRMTFYLGARIALDAAARSPMALMHVAAELRTVDKKLKQERLKREVSICPAVNIS